MLYVIRFLAWKGARASILPGLFADQSEAGEVAKQAKRPFVILTESEAALVRQAEEHLHDAET